MKDKRFIKVKKTGEERYFFNKAELIRFVEKQTGISLERLYSLGLSEKNILVKTDFNAERVVFGNFVWKITKGNFGKYKINILAEQSALDLSLNDQILLTQK